VSAIFLLRAASTEKDVVMDRQSSALAERPDSAQAIQLVVDLNRCQAYAQCCFLAPDVFELHGQEALWYDANPDPAQHERVLAAAAACPVQAIILGWSQTARRRKADGQDG
jgi:ferredoxin